MYIIFKIKLYNTKEHTTTPKAGEDTEQQEFSYIDSGNTKWYSQVGRQVSRFLFF